MKSFIPLFLILFSTFLYSQTRYYTFSELRGMEDQTGNTHLFYRMYYNFNNKSIYIRSDNIYHLDLSNKIDTLFLQSEINQDYNNPIIYARGNNIYDFQFYHHDPAKYIYCGSWIYNFEVGGFIARFDEDPLHYQIFYNLIGNKIGLSEQNDSLVYIDHDGLNRSTDGGRSWNNLNLPFYGFVSLSPYNDQEIFALNNLKLMRSLNGCISFTTVDSSSLYTLSSLPQLFYDKDRLHIYEIVKSNNNSYLYVSNNNGDPDSWELKYSGNKELFFTVDDSTSGSIYLADGKNIFHSTDYGNSFLLYKKLGHNIVGIYKKPNSNKLYAATKYKLVEISSDSLKILKQLLFDPKILNYYPLEVGNKWIYNVSGVTYEPDGPHYFNHIVTKKVLGDTVMNNKMKYFILKEDYKMIDYERIDSTTGKIYRYTADSAVTNNEFVIDDLLAAVGDTIYSNYYTRYYGRYAVFEKEDSVKEFNSTFATRQYSIHESLGGDIYNLTDGLGIDYQYYEFDFGYAIETLKGAVINGIIYGDTTITDIKDNKNVPMQFSLSQNYPNPFNPSTTIKYQISKESNVTIKIFDALGREVTTLLNAQQKTGEHEVEWNAKGFASGIYFYQIRAGDFIATKKMLLIK